MGRIHREKDEKGRKWEEYTGKRIKRGGNEKNTQGRGKKGRKWEEYSGKSMKREEMGRIRREEDKKGRKWEEYAGKRIIIGGNGKNTQGRG
jgi:hypothetical protein